MYAKALINGLNRFIVEVEKLPADTIFNMYTYSECVIGKTLGWPSRWELKEAQALKRYFDIRRGPDYCYFASTAGKHFKPEHWEVIRLFTADIGNYVSKQNWLTSAKKQLAKMQKTKGI